MKINVKIFVLLASLFCTIHAQDFRSTDDAHAFLLSKMDLSIKELKVANDLLVNGKRSQSLEKIGNYFSQAISQRFYFNWLEFKDRLAEYSSNSKSQIENHKRRASEMMDLYSAINDWNLPMKSIGGKDLSAYEFRHLARQHKALDVMFTYYYEKEDISYLNYLLDFVSSLEESYKEDSFEKKGNGVFESFRAGYRVYNWLFVYNALCATNNFNAEMNFQFIKAFYYHAVELQKTTRKFRYGNHHTKGLVALAMIAMLFPEFEESDSWLDQSIELLAEHLNKEINDDGFQFERSIHYHVGDIDNYFYVYYLAKINGIELPSEFQLRLYKMFEALTKLAYPNKTLPVLQDDTDSPWAEFNKMQDVMSLGYILFDEPSFRYFASDKVSSSKYWFVSRKDKQKLRMSKGAKPEIFSTSLNETGYYTMRNGWSKNDIVITVSAGLSAHKPDHQHGDMLGMQLYAYQNYMLPNYQVRYYLDEFQYFKNSFVKNVCIVDSIPHGRSWKGNRGGSGFGKFLLFPEPIVEEYYTSSIADLFIGRINYEDTEHERKIIFVKEGLIFVKDKIHSSEPKKYQQIWQGKYSREDESRFRSTFANGSGLDIIQLRNISNVDFSTSTRGKSSIIFNSPKSSSHEFLTLLYPFGEFDTRIDERYNLTGPAIPGWNYSSNELVSDDLTIKGSDIFYSHNLVVSFSTSSINNIIFDKKKHDVLIDLRQHTFLILEKSSSTNGNNVGEYMPIMEYKIPGIEK
jgi:hypothetical protein